MTSWNLLCKLKSFLDGHHGLKCEFIDVKGKLVEIYGFDGALWWLELMFCTLVNGEVKDAPKDSEDWQCKPVEFISKVKICDDILIKSQFFFLKKKVLDGLKNFFFNGVNFC